MDASDRKAEEENVRDANYVVIPAMSVVALLLVRSLPPPSYIRIWEHSPHSQGKHKPTKLINHT